MESPLNSREFLTYRGYLLLLRIAEAGGLILNISKSIILEELTCIYKEMSLNELEITLFSIYLERFGWRSPDPLTKVLHFASYTAKCFLNDHSISLEDLLKRKHSYFTEYSSWIAKYRSSLTVDFIELNYAYKKLTAADVIAEEIDCYDYNLAVTQLIETSTKPEKAET